MFIAYAQQNYEGCDYTIGCAQTLWRLKAKTRDEAIKELKLRVIGNWEPDWGWEDGYWEEQALEKVVLFEVSSEEDAPLGEWYTDAKKHEFQEKAKVTEKEEKDQLKKLMAKYN